MRWIKEHLRYFLIIIFFPITAMEKPPEEKKEKKKVLAYYTQFLPTDLLCSLWPYMATPGPARDNRADYLLEQKKTINAFKKYIQETQTNADLSYSKIINSQMNYIKSHPLEQLHIKLPNSLNIAAVLDSEDYYAHLVDNLKSNIEQFKNLPIVEKESTILHLFKCYMHSDVIKQLESRLRSTSPKATISALIQEMLAQMHVTICDPESRFSLLRYAIMAHNKEMVDFLILKRVDPNLADRLGVTPLIAAALSGNQSIVESLLGHDNITVNALDAYGYTALMYAAKNNYDQIVKMLLKRGANPCRGNEKKYTNAFVAAVQGGSLSILKSLLKKPLPANNQTIAMHLDFALNKAARLGRENMIQAILGARYKSIFNGISSSLNPDLLLNNRSALMQAITHEHTGIAQQLIEYSRERYFFGQPAIATGRSLALSCAIHQKFKCDRKNKDSQPYIKIIDELLNDKADPLMNQESPSACFMAASHNDMELFAKLISAAQEQKPLFHEKIKPLDKVMLEAALLGNRNAVRLALISGANANVCEEGTGRTPLMKLAVTLDANNLTVLDDLLIEADPTAQDSNHDTVLHRLVHNKNGMVQEKILKKLLAAGAGPAIYVKNKQGKTPLLYALAQPGATTGAFIKTLLAYGADPNDACPNQGNTALMYAVEYGDADMVSSLLDYGARTNDQNNSGCGALSKAALVGNVEIINLLLENKGPGGPADFEKFKESMLREAAKGNHWDLMETLIDMGTRLDGKSSSYGHSALHKAAQKQNSQAVKVLLKNNANTNAVNFLWQTPLEIAVINRDLKSAKLMMNA